MSTTYMRQELVLRRCVEAVSSMPVRALVTVGPTLDPAAFQGGDIGFGGHFNTRSRRYSTTLRALRRARRSRRRRELIEAREHAEDTTLVVGSWTYADTGWRTTADALLAASAAARARERRRVARDELSMSYST